MIHQLGSLVCLHQSEHILVSIQLGVHPWVDPHQPCNFMRIGSKLRPDLYRAFLYRVGQKSCKWGIPNCRMKYEDNKARVKQRRSPHWSIFCHMQRVSHQKSFSHSIVNVMCMCLQVNKNLPCYVWRNEFASHTQ